MTRILLLSTSDTDLLSARASGADFDLGNPSRTPVAGLPERLTSVDLVVVRILGTARTWQDGLDAIAASGTPTVVLGGEQLPDAELMSLSTVPVGTAAQAHLYLAQGGPANLTQLHAFLSDTVLLTGEGFEAPAEMPTWGWLDRSPAGRVATRDRSPAGRVAVRDRSPAGRVAVRDERRIETTDRARIGILFYRAHESSGNAAFVHDLADAIDATGEAVGLPIFSSSLRSAPADLIEAFGTLDALIVTVLAAGGSKPATAGAGEDDEAWDVAAMAALDIPILQGLCLTWSREDWAESDDGLSPIDSANQVAIPEFDGRIITVPFSFKEIDEDGLPSYVADEERCHRLAGIAVSHARLRRVPPKDRKVALMLSAYPTKHSRIGNAVGLDTPVTAIRLLRAMREAGYDLGPVGAIPGLDDVEPIEGEEPDTTAGNALIHALIDAGGQDEEWLTHAQLDDGTVRVSAGDYRTWTANLPDQLRDSMRETWGEAPGSLFVNKADEIVLATIQAGNVVILIQPPRGFGENPVAIYHDPDMPPSHHYLAAYRWLERGFGAHAVVHLGKHGSMEWLPGKNAAMSATCATDAAIGNMPLIYPFLINDPGEGAQAKRRAHATIIDHLVPPMARAESYGDIARLEQLLDEHANIAAMDPAKLPAIRAQIWTLIQAAKMDHDLGLDDRPHDAEFDDFLLHVDGWLCEVKDAQIRDGLHVLGQAPSGEARVNLVLAILRASQVWAGQAGALPGLRTALGLKEGGSELAAVDAVEQQARTLVQAMEDADWAPAAAATVVAEHAPTAESDVRRVLEFAATEVVPRLGRTTDELTNVLHALDGGYIPAGPSGSPLRGLVNVLPTGRNFYTVDPKAVPSQLAFETGQQLATSLLERYVADTGDYPRSVGLSVWGTSAMRTSGDDIAEVLALLGVRPIWDPASRRVTELQVVPLDELGRPRIDVTVRISGFFRDAFPHVVTMLDDAVQLVAALDEPEDQNFVRAHAQADLAEHGDERRATTRIFGSKPGAYGAGILPLIESGSWRDDKDLAEVYTTWGGYAYGRDLDGAPAQEDMRTSYRRIAVAAKNTDTREHDIADSDDYFQYHGGMVATVRALTGEEPAAYIGDSTSPDVVRTRSLGQETSRVFRARVVNPRWISAMRRHGYKGAFELAATVDYLFGYDATTGVVTDHMYETLAQTYALDEETQAFMRHANPWALRGIIERLHEAHERELWAEPEPGTLEALQQVYLELEGDLEDRESR
ncbi:cobaltochelatase subunit CobN [Luteipulveratus mongoliensis]|uniref:Cobalamin biosynthesis protein CobN n=1 Tax=Luteipulveratus mongoliensis TaxID=571913 RepID=A0A0K1JM71_9MICO|nr:cobaltochelatase subunit CobN [Luteipulveratus mongoliensis]AKU17806.1 cobalamin biosynthesis protein CobN [Luteipulveratus mongoliensis]